MRLLRFLRRPDPEIESRVKFDAAQKQSKTLRDLIDVRLRMIELDANVRSPIEDVRSRDEAH